jgi:hypothetical protein
MTEVSTLSHFRGFLARVLMHIEGSQGPQNGSGDQKTREQRDFLTKLGPRVARKNASDETSSRNRVLE